MSPLVKKAMAALAVKEVVDRVQEARRPKKSFVGRNKGKALWAAVLGGGAYLYKSGKLGPLVQQAKNLTGRSSGPSAEPGAYPTGPSFETRSPAAQVSDSQSDRPLEPSHS